MDKKQVFHMDDGKWFRTIEDITTKGGVKINAGTAMYVTETSTTKWWTISCEDGNTHEISKFEGAVPE